MYFADLTPYSYWLSAAQWGPDGPESSRPEDQFVDTSRPRYRGPNLNVGWLDSRYEFSCYDGAAPIWVDRLERYSLDHRCMQTRGAFLCPFCARTSEFHASPSALLLGSSEIAVQGAGVVYRAPALIAHYCRRHRYLPPPGFVEALVACATPSPTPSSTVDEIDVNQLRGPIDPQAVDATVRRLCARRLSAGEMEIELIRFEPDVLRVHAMFRSIRGAERREWKIASGVVVNNEQVSEGLSSMLLSVCQEHMQELTWSEMLARRK